MTILVTDDIYSVEAPFGIIDMGSNGIRFGIVQSLKRHLPASYEERAPISLLEAQSDTGKIPDQVIDQVITTFKRFQKICELEGIDPLNIKVIATEATRVASNSKEFLSKIHESTGLTVTILSKEEEAIISSMGIAGSFYKIDGLTMDLGGGSVELNYITLKKREAKNPRKRLRTSPSPVSMPYGALVMKKRIANCAGDKEKLKALEDEIIAQYKKAKETTQIPDDLDHKKEGYTVYMSGGGFRALGYLSMAVQDHHADPSTTSNGEPLSPTSNQEFELSSDNQEPVSPSSYLDPTLEKSESSSPISSSDLEQPSLDLSKVNKNKTNYPIPIITGYCMTGDQLKDLVEKFKYCDPDVLVTQLKAFRISKRRAKMIPAICFLVSAMIKVIKVKQVYFSEGGLRQGLCYNLLPLSEQDKDPLLEGIVAYTEPLTHYKLTAQQDITLLNFIRNVIPSKYLEPNHPFQLHRIVPAALLLSNITTHYPKETRAYVAFQMPLASGPLANLTGLLHHERCLLSLLLAYRQGGEVPDPMFQRVQEIVGKEAVSVCKYVGKLMEIVFTISPRLPTSGVLTPGVQFNLKAKESPVESYELDIILSKASENPLVHSPGVFSLIESANKKIQPKKMGDRINLFSVNLVHA